MNKTGATTSSRDRVACRHSGRHVRSRRRWSATLVLLTLPIAAAAHHSIGAIFDRSQTMEVEGTVSSVFWRNPHIGLTLLVENETGEPEEWEIEGGTYNDLLRSGFDTETVAVGDPVRIVGAPSRRGLNEMYLDRLLSPAGEELMNSGVTTTDVSVSQDSEDRSLPTGIFRGWVNGGTIHQLREPLSVTPAAEAARAVWDPFTDDPSHRCQAPGMPNAVLNPYPMEFVDEGERIVQRIEEWDTVRTIHMSADTVGQGEAAPLGHSVGRWEGKTLVVETANVDYPLLDDSGTPMSPAVRVVERYTLSEDDTRLDLELTVTDPPNLAEPAVWVAVWAWEPGVRVRPFECTVR